MNVNKWGPGAWDFLHSMTFNYPLNPTQIDKNNYSNYFNSLSKMLPCKYCKQSYEIYIKYIPIGSFLDSREGVCYWLYKIHELINQKIFKKNISFKEVITKYETFRAKCGKITVNDGDVKKKYNSCQKNIKSDDEYIEIFLKKSYSYDCIINSMIKKLYKSSENPNIDTSKKIKYIIIYS